MAGRPFCGADRRSPLRPAKHTFDSLRFGAVAQYGRGAVCVDIADFPRQEAGARQSTAHTGRGAFAVRRRRRHVITVVCIGVTRKHSLDFGTACQRMCFGLDQKRSSALPYDKAVAVDVERPAGTLRLVIAAGQRFGLCEPRDHHRAKDRFAADGKHGFGFARPEQHRRGHDGIPAGRAGGIEREAGAVNAVRDRDPGCRHVADHHRHKVGADAARPSLAVPFLRMRHRTDAVHRGPHHDADPVRLRLHGKGAVVKRFFRRHPGILHERIHRAHKRPGQIRCRIKAADLGGDLHRQLRSVKTGDFTNAAYAVDQVLPVFRNTDSNGGACTHSRDHQFLFIHYFPSFPVPQQFRL